MHDLLSTRIADVSLFRAVPDLNRGLRPAYCAMECNQQHWVLLCLSIASAQNSFLIVYGVET